MKPTAGLAGVDGTLVDQRSPRSTSKATTSVNVPPVSMPSRSTRPSVSIRDCVFSASMPHASSVEHPAIVAPDLVSAAFKADPHPFYRHLRHEAPVYRFTVHLPDKRPAWLITRYDDVVAVLRDQRLVKDRRSAM